MRQEATPIVLCLLLGVACGSSSNGPVVDADLHPDHRHDAAPPRPPSDAVAPDLAPGTVEIAGELHEAFLELECASDEIEFQFCLPKDMGIRDRKLKFGGEPGKTYAVVLGVWGVVEGVTYRNGTKGGEHFYIGGMGTTPKTAEYGLVVGDLAYYLNHFEIGAGEHYTYGITYVTPPINIPGGAILTLYVHDPDNFVNTNHMQSEAEDPPVPLRFHLLKIKNELVQGQYVYIEVMSATPLP